MTSIIQFENVNKCYGSVTALDQVSLAIPRGIVCSILGANGAGKSTAIRLMLGLENSDSGIVEVMGMNPQSMAMEIRSRIGYVADNPVLYDWMKIKEIGWFASGFYPTGFQTEYERLLNKFDLNGNPKIKTLSKGMRAKVALSLAMAHRPELLILDEPTSGLDPLVRREFLESMIDISAEGRSVFLSSHQVSEVERVADMVIILLEGSVVCVQNLEELKRETLEVIITLPNADSPPPEIPGRSVAHVNFGHEHIWMVADLDQHQLQTVCQEQQLPAAAIRQPSLEDILLAMLRQYRRSDEKTAAADSTNVAATAESMGTQS